jgi:hypothetical protein
MTKMQKLLVLSSIPVLLINLGGCAATTPDLGQDTAQYCYTDEKVKLDNNKKIVSSETVVECSDKPKVRHFVKDAGIARKCRPYQTVVNIRGNQKNVQGFLCQFPNGTWQAVDGRYRY